MPSLQIGNDLGVAARAGKNINGGNDVMTGFDNANDSTLTAIRARLTAINGTYWTATRLDQATYNDLVYALRLADNASTI